MARRLSLLIGTLSLLAAAFLLAPTVVAGDPCFHRMDNRPAPTTGQTSQVALGDCVFTPTVTQVAVGTTVTWRNTSIQAHEVVGSNLTWGAHGKLLEPGDSIGWTFEKVGVYSYSCMIHPGMTGTVVVGDSIATALSPVAGVDGQADEDASGGDGGVSAATVGVASAAGGVGIGFLLAGLLGRRRQDEGPSAS